MKNVKDMLVPIADLKSSIELFHSEVEIYPIWLCPFKLSPDQGMLKTNGEKPEMFVDIGVYGVPKNERFTSWIIVFKNNLKLGFLYKYIQNLIDGIQIKFIKQVEGTTSF